ncbi:HigA family addiction module antitoxin [Corynebacterium felinum]|uniref:Addiction module HigA family antidote n=1 Tax=Corynebacterium felinum TaxID=131318 RepID=A0ABU2BBJ4_9CORY|nr:HigA family addiction module antitoxin [Corynebacterium felinum]MDF5820002.1 HigA family addiction module antitoxin [Corynebacterium felinum]MDR7355661.1 addiction module HigA family antidote [Corynebacterium felinum]WJY95012.1 putative HTH-type transcriptional regulator YbaQ [Corynebacterium felinum]
MAQPRHPGEILEQDFIQPAGMSHYDVAKRMYTAEGVVDKLVAGSIGVTWNLSKRLASVFGTDQTFWLQAQRDWDAANS